MSRGLGWRGIGGANPATSVAYAVMMMSFNDEPTGGGDSGHAAGDGVTRAEREFVDEVDRWFREHSGDGSDGDTGAGHGRTAAGAALDRLMGLLGVGLVPTSERARSLLVESTIARVRRGSGRGVQLVEPGGLGDGWSAIGMTEPGAVGDDVYADQDGVVACVGGVAACTPASAEALDDLIAAGWDAGSFDRAGSSGRGRAEGGSGSVAGLLSLLGEPVDGEADRMARIDRTMSAVRADASSRRRRMRLDPEGGRMVATRSFRLADLVSIAAMLVIGVGMLWPMLVTAREKASINACTAGMQQAGIGFGLFAGDHDGRMPAAGLADGGVGELTPVGTRAGVWLPMSAREASARGLAAPSTEAAEARTRAEAALGARAGSLEAPKRAWWEVGNPSASHSANLFVVVRHGYTHLEDTACPGNEQALTSVASDELAAMRDWSRPEQVSYSYQLFAGMPPRLWDRPRDIVLADRSPVVERARRGEAFHLAASSLNHGGHGQVGLSRDGSVRFLESPTLANGDNIWVPQTVEAMPRPRLSGTEFPQSPGDVFLGP